MRILFSAVPAFGHFLPLVPFVRAARDGGHSVAVLMSPSMAAPVATELPGVTFLAAGPDAMEIVTEVGRRFPGADPINDPQPETVAEFFAGARIDLAYGAALATAKAWEPDVVFVDGADFVGPIVAATLGVPHVMVTFGPEVPPEFTQPMILAANSRYEERGLTMQPPIAIADPTPRSLQGPDWVAKDVVVPFRSEPYRRVQVDEVGHDAPTGRPVVLVTLGTVFNDGVLLEEIVRSVAALDVDVVATLGVQLSTAPFEAANVRYEGFRPLAELLPGADVVVTTGGAGTVLAAASTATPMVILPQGADQFLNAARAEAAHIAVVTADPSDVGDIISRVLSSDEFREAARGVAAEIADRPSIVDTLEKIVGRV
jgi:UDP:flavonoid glycosyltransferase YjiC (YdhE family)